MNKQKPVLIKDTHAGKNLCTQINKVGQSHINTVYIRYFSQGNHLIYGHTRCIYTILANPTSVHASDA